MAELRNQHNKTLGKCRNYYEASNFCNNAAKVGFIVSIAVYVLGLGLSVLCDSNWKKYQNERNINYLNKQRKKC